MKTYRRITAVNPLVEKFSGGFGVLRSWGQFLKRWEEATEPWMWESLLHKGYDLKFGYEGYGEREYAPADRTLFYLYCADGWLKPHELYVEREDDNQPIHPVRIEKGVVILTNFRMKDLLVKKAMKMLCQYEFKPWLENDKWLDWYQPSQRTLGFTSRELLPTLMHFFGELGDDGEFIAHNMRTWSEDLSHAEEQASQFAVKLITEILRWNPGHFLRYGNISCLNDPETLRRNNELIRAETDRFNVAKAWAVEMLVCLDKLNVLEKLEFLDEVIISTLQKIELRTINKREKPEKPVKNHREALANNSQAAWFLDHYFKTKPPKGEPRKPKIKVRRRRAVFRR